MKKIVPLLTCIAALLAISFLIVRVTSAEAPYSNLQTADTRVESPGMYPIVQASSVDTASPTPTQCATAYSYTVSTGTIISGTNLVPGSQCTLCILPITLPFPITLYGQTYTGANISNQGNMQFTTTYTSTATCPFPIAQIGPSIIPYWLQFLATDMYCEAGLGVPCGVYTSTTGTAPDRMFIIEWRARFGGSNHEVVNFEVQLHEDSGLIDYVYGFGIWAGATIGVQDGGTNFTAYSCNSGAISQHMRISWVPGALPSCGATSTPTYTPTSMPTPSATPSACSIVYTYTVSLSSPSVGNSPVLPATEADRLAGSDCYGCALPVELPFPFTFYGQEYSSSSIRSDGTIGFVTESSDIHSCPFPFPQLGPSLLPYWSEFLLYWGGGGPGPCVQNYGLACGIYTSVSGTAPYRVYTVQWVGVFYGSNHETVNFAAKLYETTNRIDFVYATGAQFGTYSAVGVQDGGSRFTSYACDTYAALQNIVIHWTAVTSGVCPSATPTAIATKTATRTSTGTPTPTPTSTVPTGTATLTATPTTCSINFSDVQPSDYFYEPVRYLTCQGAVSGYPDGTFRPYDNASRGQLCKIVVLANEIPINTAGGPHFIDVPISNVFYSYIETARNAQIVMGYPDGTFRWNNNLTRGQLAKIIVNARGWSLNTAGGPHFPDVPPGSTFYDFIETAYNHTILSGYPDGTFRPANSATRGQIAKVVYNAVAQP